MVSLEDYAGREQSYVKHVFLESYLEALVHKTASSYSHIVYVDGFAGPWQSANEKFEDTSFGIALNALRRAKRSWQALGRDVQMAAYLVERDPAAYAMLTQVAARFSDVTVHTYNGDFLTVLPTIMRDIPKSAFAFSLIDPMGWRIALRGVAPLLARHHSEVIFNFMFDFINRAASIKDPSIVAGLNELIPFGDWRKQLEAAENAGAAAPESRRAILVEAFGKSLKQLGKYNYVVETTVLRPLKDRPLYSLFYATRHQKGIEVFRDCQIAALKEESKTRAATKLRHAASSSGQGEIFESLHDMAPDRLETFFDSQVQAAEETLVRLVPPRPNSIVYEELRAQVLARHVVRAPDINKIAARLRAEGRILFPGWEKGKRVPQSRYQVQRV
jgi:three-Cys-motif partner protein